MQEFAIGLLTMGESTLVVSPDSKYFYIFFPDGHANGTTYWRNTVTPVSLARAPIADLLKAAFSDHPHAIAFEKYYAGQNQGQGLGGYSADLNYDVALWGQSSGTTFT